MNKVYILGAGASVGYCRKGEIIYNEEPSISFPVGDNFFQKAIEREVIKESYFKGDLLKFIKEEFNISFSELKNGRKLSIEEVYIKLDKSINESKSIKDGRDHSDVYLLYTAKKHLLEDIIVELLTQLCRYYEPCLYHAFLAKHVVETKSTIISFNWDILIDQALYYTSKWFYCTGYGFEFKKMYRDKNEFTSNKAKSEGRLLKPHGSINWFSYMDIYSNSKNGFTGEMLSDEDKKDIFLFEFSPLRKCNFQPAQKRLDIGMNYNPPLKSYSQVDIVPPGTRYNDMPNYNKIWKQVEKSIEEADEIIVIGFALKDNSQEDKEEIEKFKSAREKSSKDVKIKIVNPNADNEELIQTYKEVFKTPNVYKEASSLKEFCYKL